MASLPKYQLVLLGGGGVGKSAITLSFTRNQFSEDYDPTIEDCYTKSSVIDGIECDLDIIDTAGQEEYRGLFGDKFLQQSDGFLCVYSVTTPNSLQELAVVIEQIHRAKDNDWCPIIIVGNKVDLRQQRRVSEGEGRQLAKASNALFIETSAKEHYNVEEAFFNIVREIRRQVQVNGYQTLAQREHGVANDFNVTVGHGGGSAPRMDRSCCLIL